MKTEIILLTDTSGSMVTIDRATCAALNSFINEQCDVPGEARVTHVRFDTSMRRDFEGRLISSVNPFTRLGCGGGTALYDCVIDSLDQQSKRIDREEWADQVIFVITTDGNDRDSRHSVSAAAAAISRMQHAGWHFVFLGANIDAEKYSERLSIYTWFQFTADAAGIAEGMRSVSRQVRTLRSWGL